MKIGCKVRLLGDPESTYEIVELNPYETKGITIRRIGDGLMVYVSKSEITEIIDNSKNKTNDNF
mgnify:CR=1 FL=1